MKRKSPEPKTSAQKPKAGATASKTGSPKPKPKTRSRAGKSVAAADVTKSIPPTTSPTAATVLLTALMRALTDVEKIELTLRPHLPANQDLTGTERRRLIGAKSRNYGFIVKATEIVDDRPNFIPPNFLMSDMTATVANLEKARDLSVRLENLQRLVDDFLLQSTDAAYRGALLIYRNLQTQARGRIHGAEDLFQQLFQFFKSRGRRPNAEPTEKELEREAKQLLRGKADGEMIIKNESPHMTKGVREVMENVGKRRKRGAEIKVKEEE